MERTGVEGTVTMSISAYESFQRIYGRYVKALDVADKLADVIEFMSVQGYEVNQYDLINVCNTLKDCENKLRGISKFGGEK